MKVTRPGTHIPLRPQLGVLQIGIKSQGHREPRHQGPGRDGRYYVPCPEQNEDEIVAEDHPDSEGCLTGAHVQGLHLRYVRVRALILEPTTAPGGLSWEREETESFRLRGESAATPPPHPAYRMTARISIPEPLPVPAWSDSEVARLLAISSPPASPLSPWSSSPPQIPLPVSPPPPVLTAPPPSPIRSLGYRAATIRMRAEAASTSHSLPLLPPFILSPTRPDAPPPLPTTAPLHSLPPLSLLHVTVIEVQTPTPPLAAAETQLEVYREDYGFVATMESRRQEEIRELRAADRTRQQQIIQTLTVVQTLQREMVPLPDWSHTAGAGDNLTGTGDDMQGRTTN
ncbi:hypothetical protein Tco_0267268 [Tanacetum coccineum]